MSVWDELKEALPILSVLAALWMRLEVGQALNRSNIRALWSRRKEERGDLAETLRALRDEQREGRKETRDDIKSLREAIERMGVNR
ncbi:MAG: hypothetical protein ACK4LQ_02050 [Pararhodobacter sp.]